MALSRILHVAETAKGGVGSFLDELIPLQQARLGKSNVRAILPADHRDQLGSVAEESLSLVAGTPRSLAAIANLRRNMIAECRSFRPDIVHLNSTFAGIVGRTLFPLPVAASKIYSPHGWSFEMWEHGAKRQFAAAFERFLAKRCARIIAVSSAEKSQGMAVGLPEASMAVVRNGIDPRAPSAKAAAWQDDRLKVLFVGRLDHQKGFDTLSRIADRCFEKMSVRVAGASVASSRMDEASSPNIHQLGWLSRQDIDAQLLACDVVAMPSRWEGLPISALEAMRAAKPLVAFSVGGLAEVIDDRKTGYLLAPGDEAGFEGALLRHSKNEWQAMGVSARARFEEKFVASRMERELFEIYRDSGNSILRTKSAVPGDADQYSTK